MPSAAQLNSALAGRYEIDRQIGRGGMATVFLARDVRHDRRVALKLLDPELGAVLGADRFLSEIRVTANLQHPNLLPLFDSGEVDGLLFYVMPYVEGESLRHRLDREKQLPVDEAVHIATAIASALDHAHRHGVIHRDLKPENILLHEGQPLIADFGIALAISNAGGQRVTQTGLSLGTPQYMSPEQATGDRGIDGRTDIYSLGAVTYEMLTGEPPHSGSTAQAVIAKLMTEEPRSLTVLRRAVPAHIDAAVLRSLEKLPADRFATAAAFKDALERGGPSSTGPAMRGVRATPPTRGHRTFPLSAILAVALVIVSGFAIWQWTSPRPVSQPITQFVLDIPNEQTIGAASLRINPVDISPDGRTLAYIVRGTAGNEVAVRDLGHIGGRTLANTRGAIGTRFSYDGRSLFVRYGGRIDRLPLDGGPVVTVARPGVVGWVGLAPNGDMVISHLKGTTTLWRTAETETGARRISVLDTANGETEHRWPVVLPDGKTVAYTSWRGTVATSRLGFVSIDSGPTTIVNLPLASVIGFMEGHLLWVQNDGVFMATPFDLGAREARGTSIPLAERIGVTSGAAPALSLARNGTLVIIRGGNESTLLLLDGTGKTRMLDSTMRPYMQPRFSPDGRRLAYALGRGESADIWLYEISTGTSTRFTNGGLNDRPEWSPDGKHIIYRSDRGEVLGLWERPIDGSAPARQLFSKKALELKRLDRAILHEGVFSPNGHTMVIRVDGTENTNDLWIAEMGADTTFRPLDVTPYFEMAPQVSPDGRWVAYNSDETGEFEVYVRRLDGTGRRYKLSNDGGMEPVWSRDGTKVYYRAGVSLIATAISFSPEVGVRSRAVLHDGTMHVRTSAVRAEYDLAPDGSKFVVLSQPTDTRQVVVTVNWYEELKARLRGGK